MRYSSIISVITAVCLTVLLAVSAPAAHAGPVQREAVRTHSEERDLDRFVRSVKQMLKRLSRGVSTTALPTVPIPAPSPGK